jgi:hypothetical protein
MSSSVLTRGASLISVDGVPIQRDTNMPLLKILERDAVKKYHTEDGKTVYYLDIEYGLKQNVISRPTSTGAPLDMGSLTIENGE